MEVEGSWGDVRGLDRGWGPRVCSQPPETCSLELQPRPYHLVPLAAPQDTSVSLQ